MFKVTKIENNLKNILSFLDILRKIQKTPLSTSTKKHLPTT